MTNGAALAEPADAGQARILESLRERGGAMFASELEVTVASERSEFTRALRSLERKRQVIVVKHAPPDPHLADLDLRVVAEVRSGGEEGARNHAEKTWSSWLSRFFATHRCQ